MSGKRLAVVGSTGSIGTQALEVVAAEPGRWQVTALAARSSADRVAEQAWAVRPEVVAVADPAAGGALDGRLPPGCELLVGEGALVEAAAGADVVLNAVVGFAGLPVTVATLRRGARLALANKESLVAGGPVVRRLHRDGPAGALVPVDSEHAAIHQCLAASGAGGLAAVERLILTASGGPFRGRSALELRHVGVADALAHPTWSMGPKITVDSSTLMNKGLEVIEAHELFGVPEAAIDVVVHPQSIVHSLVEFRDGSTVAQLSTPDMRLPIGYALGYPERLGTPYGRVDLAALGSLTFEAPDTVAFPALDLARAACRSGETAPAWLNAANEVAVAAFLDHRLAWYAIAQVVDEVLQRWDGAPAVDVDDVLEADRRARAVARGVVSERMAG